VFAVERVEQEKKTRGGNKKVKNTVKASNEKVETETIPKER